MSKTILGLSGRLRRASFNAGLLRAAAELVPDGTQIQIGSIREVPLCDGELDRGSGLRMWVGKPVAAIGASPGGFDTIMALDHWLPVLRTLETSFWAEGRLMVSRAGDLFDPDGNLTDAASRERLAAFFDGFAKVI
jgi:NAD(P)H-dependent FMN reductase